MNHAAVLISHDLKFNMTRFFDEFLDIAMGDTKCIRSFRLRSLKRNQQLAAIFDHTHAATAASGYSFDDNRVSNSFRSRESFLVRVNGIAAARQHGQS